MCLVGLLAVVGDDVSYSADEGAAIIQARSLQQGDGWLIEHPRPSVDPDGVYFPLEPHESGELGRASFAKHPLYPILLSGLDPLGGTRLLLVSSIIGTLGAAMAGALLARRIGPGLDRPTLWLVGLGSPLLFDAYLLIAHSLGAAFVGFGVLALVARPGSPSLARSSLAGLLLATAVGFRSEALLMAVAIVAVLVLRAVLRRSASWALSAGIVGGIVVAARLVEQRALTSIVGAPVPTPDGRVRSVTGTGHFVDDRIQGLLTTWFELGRYGEEAGQLLLLLGMALAAFGCFLVVMRPERTRALVVVAAAAAACYAVRALFVPPEMVSGLLVVAPVLWIGLVVGSRGRTGARDGSTPGAAQLLALSSALFALAVLATQYAVGGASEWGGRYFHLMLPLLAPLALDGLRRRGAALARPARVAGAVGLVVMTVATSTLAVRHLVDVHQRTDAILAEVTAASTAAESPVIVTELAIFPRLSWATFDEQHWLLVDPAESEDLPVRFDADGVDTFTLVTRTRDDFLDAWGGDVVVVREAQVGADAVLVLRLDP